MNIAAPPSLAFRYAQSSRQVCQTEQKALARSMHLQIDCRQAATDGTVDVSQLRIDYLQITSAGVVEILSHYRFRISYRQSQANAAADALPRCF